MMMIFMHAVMAQSWNVLAGFSGQISLGHAIFSGIGAYASAYFYVKFPIIQGKFEIAGIFIGLPQLYASLVCLIAFILLDRKSVV